MAINIPGRLVLLSAFAMLAASCQHSAAYDDAWAKCQAEAIESEETAEPDADQRATYQENYIRECMSKAGFSE